MDMWTATDAAAIAGQSKIAELIGAEVSKASGELKPVLAKIAELKDYFVDKSVWIFGGDGWAYDIGYSGVDHVVAMGKNVNILVVDTEVYSNTGGQASKATPIAAVAKFANAGMQLTKKNMGFMCMSYGYVYVASIAMGANRAQAQKALMEAEAYDGPSIVFAYAPCINHGIGYDENRRLKKSVQLSQATGRCTATILLLKKAKSSHGKPRTRLPPTRTSSEARDAIQRFRQPTPNMLKSSSHWRKKMPRREWLSTRSLVILCNLIS